MKTLRMQCRAELLRIIRNPYYVFWSLLMPIMFYFIFTRVVNVGGDDASLWSAHYLMSMTTFSVMGSAIMTLGIRLVQERTQGWTTFMRITPLPGPFYFLSKMFGQTVMHLISIVLIFIAGYLNGVSLSPIIWIYCGLWVLAGSLPFLAIGTLIGSMKRVDTASGVSNMIYLVLAVMGGMWMPIDIMPRFIQHISKWLPSYNFGNGAWQIIRGDAPDWSNVLILLVYLIAFMILSTYIRKKQEVV